MIDRKQSAIPSAIYHSAIHQPVDTAHQSAVVVVGDGESTRFGLWGYSGEILFTPLGDHALEIYRNQRQK
jgi:hypothetical protein